MKVATVKLEGVTPYSQSKHYDTPHKPKELHSDYEARTWRDRCNVNEKGNIVISPMALANCVKEAAKFASIKVKGKGQATFTKHFQAGIMVSEGITLPVKKDDVEGEWLFVPSDGKPGGGSRVMKCFPLIKSWQGVVQFFILDDTITEDVFREVLTLAGKLIGIGRFRPINRGYYGRFKVVDVEWSEDAVI